MYILYINTIYLILEYVFFPYPHDPPSVFKNEKRHKGHLGSVVGQIGEVAAGGFRAIATCGLFYQW